MASRIGNYKDNSSLHQRIVHYCITNTHFRSVLANATFQGAHNLDANWKKYVAPIIREHLRLNPHIKERFPDKALTWTIEQNERKNTPQCTFETEALAKNNGYLLGVADIVYSITDTIKYTVSCNQDPDIKVVAEAEFPPTRGIIEAKSSPKQFLATLRQLKIYLDTLKLDVGIIILPLDDPDTKQRLQELICDTPSKHIYLHCIRA